MLVRGICRSILIVLLIGCRVRNQKDCKDIAVPVTLNRANIPWGIAD